MSKIDTGGPVYPIWTPDMSVGDDAGPGMSKREYFAGQAMQGLCCRATPDYTAGPCNHSIVDRAITLADQMIAALKGAVIDAPQDDA